MGNDEASRFRELLAAERRSADLYDGLAEAAHGERREILNQLAAVEWRHAEHWAPSWWYWASRCRSRGAVARVRGCCRGWRGGCPSMRYCPISSAP
ncbi:MAG: putative rane protein, partial [Mycobacterium sp.]|nr:putative rane protein [Mycobacterium sp.]